MFGSLTPVLDFLRSGRLRALGISSAKRSPLLPEVPTISEAGVPGYESGVFYALLAPAGTPKAIISRLNDALVKTLSPKVRSQFEAQGADPVASSPAELAAFLREQSEKNAKLVKASGITVN
jgi:tripartite-type tricarboxylate transporter receptor subunit TctC